MEFLGHFIVLALHKIGIPLEFVAISIIILCITGYVIVRKEKKANKSR